MTNIIFEDILQILIKAIKILEVKEKTDSAELRDLSNYTVHNASIFQDEDSISIAILVYSLSKVIERKGISNYVVLSGLLKDAKENLENGKIEKYREKIKELFAFISKIDNELKLYIGEVINQAQIKEGSKLYEHGLSSARASEILGISQWELMFYIGKTKLSEVKEEINIKERLDYARSLFI